MEERWKITQEYAKNSWSNWKLSESEERKEIIKKYWDWYLNFLKDYLKEESRILEIGCGGDGIINYISKGAKYTLDPLIDFYALNFDMPKEVKLIKGVGEKLPFKNDYFDIIITTNTLDHTKQPEKFLEEIKKTLKKDGTLFLTVNCFSPIHRFYRGTMERIGMGDEGHPYAFSFKQVEGALKKLGFDIITSNMGILDLGRYVNKKMGQKERRLARFVFWIDKKLAGYSTIDFLFIAKRGL